MHRAVVTGSVWSTRRIDGVPQGAFLEVTVSGSDATLIAFDVLGSGVGEEVLVVQGSVAAAWFPGPPPPVDALIIGSVDPAPGVASPRKTSPRKTSPRRTAAKS